MQAMDLGVPVVARRVPGNVDIIEDGRTGFLYSQPQVGQIFARLHSSKNDVKIAFLQEINPCLVAFLLEANSFSC